MFYFGFAHSYTGVFNFKNKIDSVISLYRIDVDIYSAFFGELITVSDQMPEDLFDLASVADKLGRNMCIHIHDKFKTVTLRKRELYEQVVNKRINHVRLSCNRELTHIDLGEIENVTYLFAYSVTCFGYRTDVGLYAFRHVIFFNDRSKSDNRINGGSDLM